MPQWMLSMLTLGCSNDIEGSDAVDYAVNVITKQQMFPQVRQLVKM